MKSCYKKNEHFLIILSKYKVKINILKCVIRNNLRLVSWLKQFAYQNNLHTNGEDGTSMIEDNESTRVNPLKAHSRSCNCGKGSRLRARKRTAKPSPVFPENSSRHAIPTLAVLASMCTLTAISNRTRLRSLDFCAIQHLWLFAVDSMSLSKTYPTAVIISSNSIAHARTTIYTRLPTFMYICTYPCVYNTNVLPASFPTECKLNPYFATASFNFYRAFWVFHHWRVWAVHTDKHQFVHSNLRVQLFHMIIKRRDNKNKD